MILIKFVTFRRDGCKMQSDDTSRHIIVMRRGQFYWFDVLDSRHRPALTDHELIKNLEGICKDADQLHPHAVAGGAVGVLSTENRKVWSELRDALRLDLNNKNCRKHSPQLIPSPTTCSNAKSISRQGRQCALRSLLGRLDTCQR